MSESDSPDHQKVAALAGALAAVRRHVEGRSGLFRLFHSWFRANGPDFRSWDLNQRDGLKQFLEPVAEYVEAVDTANRMLDAVPVSVLEPLSGLTGGVRWDVRTRRTLRTIQRETCFLRRHSRDSKMFYSELCRMGKDGFMEMQSRLKESGFELAERIFDLQCLPDEPTKPMGAITDQRRAIQEPVQSEGGSVLQSTAMLVEIKANSEGSLLGTPKQTTKEREAVFDDAISGYADSDWRRDKRLNNKAWRVRSKEQTGELFGDGVKERGWYQLRTGQRVIKKDEEGAWVYLTASHSEKLKVFFSAFVA